MLQHIWNKLNKHIILFSPIMIQQWWMMCTPFFTLSSPITFFFILIWRMPDAQLWAKLVASRSWQVKGVAARQINRGHFEFPLVPMICCSGSLTGCYSGSAGTIYQLKASSGVQAPAAAALVATNSAARVSAAILVVEELTPHQVWAAQEPQAYFSAWKLWQFLND